MDEVNLLSQDRGNLKKRRVFILCLVVSVIVVAIGVLFYNLIYPSGEIPRINGTESEERITSNVQKIFRAYTKYDSVVYLVTGDNDSNNGYMPGFEGQVNSLLKNGRQYIRISEDNNGFLPMDENPSEIYAIIRIMIYLKDNSANISGVSCFYYTGVVDSLSLHQIIFSNGKFNELYNRFYNPNISDKDNAQILGDKWLGITKFKKGANIAY